MPRASQEQIAKVHFGALAQAVLLRRPEYFAVLEDHAVATGWVPAGTEFVSQHQGPDRFFVQHHQKAPRRPWSHCPPREPCLPIAWYMTRALTALVPGVTTTLTLRLAWSASGGRLLVRGSGHRAG